MKAIHYLLSAVCCALPTWMRAQHMVQKSLQIEVRNPWQQPQIDAPVVINLHELNLPFTVGSAIATCEAQEIPSQIDDLDGNGTPDEVALVIDLEAKATKQITLTLSEEKHPNPYPARTFAQMLIRDAKKGKHAQAESLTVPGSANVYNLIYGHGPMMESELVGYRIYFNQKQTLDPYGKFIKRLELASCSFYPSDKQLAEGYGDDVLMVGNSCGIGALKGWDGKQATHMEPIASRTERVVSSGPVRAILEVTVKGWSYQGTTLNLTQRYLLYAGHRDLQIDVIASTEEQKEITFATGVQHIMGTETVMESDHCGLVGSWGRHWPVTDTVKYAKETIGIATSIPQRYVKQEVEDKDNYLYEVKLPQNGRFTYHTMFTSRKEQFGFADEKAWFAYMRQWKEQLEHPVKIKTLPAPLKGGIR